MKHWLSGCDEAMKIRMDRGTVRVLDRMIVQIGNINHQWHWVYVPAFDFGHVYVLQDVLLECV